MFEIGLEQKLFWSHKTFLRLFKIAENDTENVSLKQKSPTKVLSAKKWRLWEVAIIINNNNDNNRPGGLGSWRMGRDYSKDSIAENSQNPETSPGNWRRLAVTQTPVKNHQQTLMWKTLMSKKKKIKIIKIRPDLIMINKKKENLQNSRLCCSDWPQNKT